MAPSVRDAELATLTAPSTDSDMGRPEGSNRKKYAGAFAMFALVAVMVGGVGMHRSHKQDTEIGDIIEACGDYSVESTCSAASCDWDGVKCNVAKVPKSGVDPLLVQRTSSMRISEEREAAVINCGTENATSDLGLQFSAATAGQSEDEIKKICQKFLDACPSTEDQTWITARPRCAGMTPTPATDCTEAALGAQMAGKAESEMTAICQAFANACPTALSVVTARPRCAGVTAATAAATPAPFGGHDTACHQQFSAATVGKSDAEIVTICNTYKTGTNGACLPADGAGWITTWCASRR